MTKVYTYRNISATETTTQIATCRVYGGDYDVTYTYTYDDNGNILSINDGTYTTSYVYDSQNQLLRENNQEQGYTYTWVYDDAGNMLYKMRYAYTTGTLGTATSTYNYTYDDDWGDVLLGVGSTTYTVDAIGNRTSDGYRSYTWEHGRQLASVTYYSNTWQYKYNNDGMLIEQRNGNDVYTYVYNGTQLSQMTYEDEWEAYTMHFTYDANGTPLTVTFDYACFMDERTYDETTGTFADDVEVCYTISDTYYYITNIQGDVIELLNSDGESAGYYRYDAWGNIIDTLDNEDVIYYNPLRYRGYFLDPVSNLYYLQTRFYDASVGRFINADNVMAGASESVQGHNLFAYCFNNPVNLTDEGGNWPNWGKLVKGASLLAIGLVACAAAATVVSGGACAPLLVAACTTFAAGGMTVLNGTAEMVESVTDYNYMRDTVYGGDNEFYEAQKDVFETVAEIGTASLGVTSGSPALCFVAGTMVLVSEGTKAIESVKTGDYVWSWDEETGDIALKQVVETYVNQTTELVHVFINGEEIITTPSHPFYSPVKGWTDAAQLRAGDILVLVNGEYVVVEKILHEILESPITVYNFQVEDYHTYYVADIGVLVHNSCGGETAATARGRQMHKEWDYGIGVSKEQTIGQGARVDGIDWINKIVYELKPNNSRAIQRGMKQLDRYLGILGEADWAGVLILYD